jgi:hypothetical protein
VNFQVSVAHEAEKILDRLDRPTEQRVRARFVQLAVDPFDSRLSGPLADRPGTRPNSKLEAAYHNADKAIQTIVDLLAAASCYRSNVEVFLFTIFVPRIYEYGASGYLVASGAMSRPPQWK